MLLERIKQRGRDYERNIKKSYLECLQTNYENFLEFARTELKAKILIINTDELNKE